MGKKKKNKNNNDTNKHYFILKAKDNRPVGYTTDGEHTLKKYLSMRDETKLKVISIDDDELPEEISEYLMETVVPIELVPCDDCNSIFISLKDEEVAIDYLDNFLSKFRSQLDKLQSHLEYFKFNEEEQRIVKKGMASLENFAILYTSSFGPTEDDYENAIDFGAFARVLVDDGIID